MPSNLEFNLAQKRFKALTSNGRKMEIASLNGNLFTSDGRVYVRELGGFSSGGVTIRNVPSPVQIEMGRNVFIGEGRVVLVKKDYQGRDYIYSNDRDDLRQATINPRQLNANDPSARYKTISLLSDLQTFPTGGDGTVMVHPGAYRKNNGEYENFSGLLQIDLLSSYTPAVADNQHIVALWIDVDTNAITITTSSEISQATDLKLDIPTAISLINEAKALAPTNYVGIGSYIIKGDDTTVGEQNKFIDLRGIIEAFGQSSAGFPDPVDFDFVIGAGHTLIVKDGWTISAGGSVTVETGAAVCTISNSPNASISTKTVDYTMVRADDIIKVDASSANVTITLPDATTAFIQRYDVKAIALAGNSLTIDTVGSQTVDGDPTIVVTVVNSNITMIPDGANWWVI